MSAYVHPGPCPPGTEARIPFYAQTASFSPYERWLKHMQALSLAALLRWREVYDAEALRIERDK